MFCSARRPQGSDGGQAISQTENEEWENPKDIKWQPTLVGWSKGKISLKNLSFV